MASAADFLKTYAAPKPEPAAGGQPSAPEATPSTKPQSASELISKATGKPFTAPKKPANDVEEEGGLAGQMVEGFVAPMKEAWHTLGADYETSQGAMASPEAYDKYKKSGVVDRLKTDAKGFLATAKLPLDAVNVGLSPVVGAYRGGIVTPVAKGLHAMQDNEKPSGYVAPYTDEKGKKHEAEVLTPAQIKAYQKQLTKPHKKQQDYFKESELRPRPLIHGTTQEIAAGLTEYSIGAATSLVPGDVMAFRSPGGKGTVPVPRSTFGNFTSRPVQTATDFAKRKIAQALKAGGITKEEAKAKLSKPGTSISDLGDDRMLQIGEQAALSGEGRRLGANLYVDDRLKGRRGRVVETVNKLANDKNMYEHIDELKETQIANARPLYQEAFSSSNPLQIEKLTEHLEGSFNKASKAVNEAVQELRDAENMVTMANARHVGESENVAQQTARNQALRDANRRKLMAEEKLDQAKTARENALERLNTMQEHDTNGVMGGVWSERLDELMKRPWVTEGLPKGIEIQTNEATIASEAPNLNHYALKPGSNVDNPIPSLVPNLRLLDAMKRGMDASLRADYYNKETGKLDLDELGKTRQGLRDEFVTELDKLTAEGGNNAYAGAREAWAGPARIQDAVFDGTHFDKSAPEVLTKKLAKMNAGELEGYRIGVVRKIADKVAEGPSAALRVAKDIVNDEYYQRQLKAVLGEEHFAHMLELAEREVSWAERGHRIMGGSPTMRLKEGSKEFESTGSEALDDVLGSFNQNTGAFATLNPKHMAMSWFRRWGGRVLDGMTQSRRDATAKLMFSTDKDDNLRALDMIYDEGMMTLPDYPAFKKAGATAGIGQLTSSPDQEKETEEEPPAP